MKKMRERKKIVIYIEKRWNENKKENNKIVFTQEFFKPLTVSDGMRWIPLQDHSFMYANYIRNSYFRI